MDPRLRLEELLVALFPSIDDMRRFVRAGADGSAIIVQLTQPTSPQVLAHEVVTNLNARGLIDEDFFDRLVRARPRRRREVAAAAEPFVTRQVQQTRLPRRNAGASAARLRGRASRKAPTVQKFILDDHVYTFYPLEISRAVYRSGPALKDALSRVLRSEEALCPQHAIFPAKPRGHIRRTVQLDPVAAWLLYDLVYRNRAVLSVGQSRRLCFGNVILDDTPVRGNVAYSQYKGAIEGFAQQFRHRLSFDVANFFNHIDRSDIIHWAERRGFPKEDVSTFDLVLQSVSSDLGTGCLPQGFYPAKMIGNSYLSFLEESSGMLSARSVRFMDDVTLFDDSEVTLLRDFRHAQQLLGERGLAVNPQKTVLPDEVDESHVDIEDWKVELLQLRSGVTDDVSGLDDEDESGQWEPIVLTRDQQKRLIALAQDEDVSQQDAELVLTLLQPYAEDLLDHLSELVGRYPNLAKRMYSFCRKIEDREAVCDVVLQHVRESPFLSEYELFWISAMLDDYLLDTDGAGELCSLLLHADGATDISRSRLLQVQDSRYGLPEERDRVFREGRPGWQRWSAAFGAVGPGRGRRSLRAASGNSVMDELVLQVLRERAG